MKEKDLHLDLVQSMEIHELEKIWDDKERDLQERILALLVWNEKTSRSGGIR